MTVLEKIIDSTRERVESRKKTRPVEDVENPKARSLKKSIRSSSNVPVIGELKKSSPSSSTIRSTFDARELARSMEEGGAAGLSVLTEPTYFGGDEENLTEVRNSTTLPVLRKDFIVDEYQIYRSAEMNADAVLLIARMLGEELYHFVDLVEELNMEPLVEVHNEEELKLAVKSRSSLIGINNRNLETMEIDSSRTSELAGLVPEGFALISESGIKSRKDVIKMVESGADGVLVGTEIMEATDVEKRTRELVSGGEND